MDLTNATIALIVFTLETNWGSTHILTPVQGFPDTTVYHSQTARVERVETHITHSRGKEKRLEVDREFMAEMSTNIPPRIWPSNAPPSLLSVHPQLMRLRNRGDYNRAPEPPVPPLR